MSRVVQVVSILLVIVACVVAGSRSVAGSSDPVLVELRDSLSASGLVPADDTCYTRYPDSLLADPFKKVFVLYTSDGVANGTVPALHPGWTQAQFDSFMTFIIDSDTTTSVDVFPRVWDYFCYVDSAAAEDSVQFNGMSKIELSLYHGWNFKQLEAHPDQPYYCDGEVSGSLESKMFGTADENTILWPANASKYSGCGLIRSHALLSPEVAAKGGVFAHELQHLADRANSTTNPNIPTFRVLRSEFLSAAGEYVGGQRWEGEAFRRVRLVNRGLYHYAAAEFYPFNLYRLFWAYMFAHFSGASSDPTDDLVYKWVRAASGGGSGNPHGDYVGTMLGLGEVLTHDFPDSVPGGTPAQRVARLYQRFAMARFANDSTSFGGIYGFGGAGVTPRNFAWFEWVDTCNPRVGWMPPEVVIADSALASEPIVIDTWVDPVDTVHVNSSRELQLESYGSEYLVVRADTSLYGPSSDLSIDVVTDDPLPAGYGIRIGVLEYAQDSDSLFTQSLRAATDSVALAYSGGALDTTVELEAFGDSTRAAVVVVSLIQDTLTSWPIAEVTVPISASVYYVPDTTRVPGDEGDIQNAIDASDPGDVVLVDGKALGFAYEESLTLARGVRVIGVDVGDGLPRLDAGAAATAVAYPSDANSFTRVENFLIEGGTDEVVRLRGAGEIRNCALEGTGEGADYGVRADSTLSGAAITDCSISLDSGTGVWLRSGTASGIEVTQNAGTGILLADGTATLTDGDVRVLDGTGTNVGVETEVDAGSGAFSLSALFVRVPGGTGVALGSAGSTISLTTVDSVDVGIDGAVGTVSKCIVSNYVTSGFDGAPVSLCLADGSGTTAFAGNTNTGTGLGNEVGDPMYCDAQSEDFRVSVQAPLAGTAGKFAIGCLYGTFSSIVVYEANPVLRRPDTLRVPGDLKITGTLTINEGTTLLAASTPLHEHLGGDSTLVEILVDATGTLQTSENPDGPVAFLAEVNAEGEWAGIRVRSGGSLLLDSVWVANATVGVRADSFSTLQRVEASVFAANSERDIMASGTSGGHPFYIERNVFTVGQESGIECVRDCDDVKILDNTFTGIDSSVSGILVSDDGGSPLIEGNSASGFTAGTPLKILGGSATVHGNTFEDSKYGIHVFSGSAGTVSPAIGGSGAGESNELADNTNGLRSEKSDSAPVVRYNYIHSNTHGILTALNSNPDLGTSSEDGSNSITNNTTYCIWNRNSSQGIVADGNWFGSCATPTCANGPVVIATYLCTSPLSRRDYGTEPVHPAPPFVMLGFSPNPLRGAGEFYFELGEPAHEIVLRVFDVRGRLIRELRAAGVQRGRYSIPWDGTDRAGSPVASGLYFVRAVADQRDVQYTKVLVMR